jgi:hypothetical protein
MKFGQKVSVRGYSNPALFLAVIEAVALVQLLQPGPAQNIAVPEGDVSEYKPNVAAVESAPVATVTAGGDAIPSPAPARPAAPRAKKKKKAVTAPASANAAVTPPAL